MDRIVRLTHQGRVYTFRVDPDPPLAFWRVEAAGRAIPSPVRVLGDEEPGFFRTLAEWADRQP